MRNQTLFLLALTSTIFAIAGCSPDPEIVTHRVPKNQSGLDKLQTTTASPTAKAAPQTKTRMAVAIFDRPEATWFFKISGPESQVDKSESQWQAFLKTIKFTDNEPQWTAPEAWKSLGPKPMRHATLVINDTNPPIEVAISNLSAGQNLLDNVNRWRRQIGLKPSSEQELDSQITKLKSGDEPFLLFDAIGAGSGTMAPPFAGGGAAPFAGGNAPFAGGQAPFAGGGQTAQASGWDFDLPDGWTKSAKTSRMVPVRLVKTDGDQEIQITMIEMPASVNEWAPNVTRWAGQVGLGGLSEDDLKARTSELSVDGTQGQQIDLIDLDSESKQGAIAGMIKLGDSAWFLKLSGDKQLASENRGDFDKFLESLKSKK